SAHHFTAGGSRSDTIATHSGRRYRRLSSKHQVFSNQRKHSCQKSRSTVARTALSWSPDRPNWSITWETSSTSKASRPTPCVVAGSLTSALSVTARTRVAVSSLPKPPRLQSDEHPRVGRLAGGGVGRRRLAGRRRRRDPDDPLSPLQGR